MIKAVIFDCFGVLTADHWREFVDNLPPQADVARARELNHQYDAQLITVDEFLEQVEEATGERPVQVEKMLDNETSKNAPLLEYIKQLKADYKIGLLSNIGTNWIRDSFLTQEEQNMFDSIVLSYEVGTTKPDPRIYEIACERLGVAPQDAVFTDDIKGYCEAAEEVGLRAIHYQGFRQLKRDLDSLLDHA